MQPCGSLGAILIMLALLNTIDDGVRSRCCGEPTGEAQDPETRMVTGITCLCTLTTSFTTGPCARALCRQVPQLLHQHT